jgi:hypothetical protein
MHLVCLVTLCLCPGEVFTETVKVNGVGEIALPPGEWELEITHLDGIPEHGCETHVFKKCGERLERMSVQRFSGRFAHPMPAYFDSIAMSFSHGIPTPLAESENVHDSVCPIGDVEELDGDDALMASYVYTGNTDETNWMSHAIVHDHEGVVIVCVHASPFVISPELVKDLYMYSEFDTEYRATGDTDAVSGLPDHN